MSPQKYCLVGALGLQDHEISLIQSIFRVSHSRNHIPYKLIYENFSKAHIIIASIDNMEAIETWHKLVFQNSALIQLSVTPKELGAYPGYSFSRPFSPTKLLDRLDQIVEKELSSLFGTKIFNGEDTAKHRAFVAAEKQSTTQFRALVVDDSKTVQAVLKRELNTSNILTDIAGTGELGLEMIANNHYDIIFLDVVLPGLDGYQVCKTIRRNQNKKDIPVIMMSGNTSPFDKVRGKMSGCNTYLTKPVDYAKFYNALDHYVIKSNGR